MTNAGTESVVLFSGVDFAYQRNNVLEDVTLNIAPRDFAWIVGPNGGGKTTLAKLILGLLRPVRGELTVFGATPSHARRRIGYMPQQARLDLQFPVTVLDVALMGCLRPGGRPGPYSAEDRRSAGEALERVSLESEQRRSLRELSGGQQRRLLIARALAGGPELLVLDEPTANLDRPSEEDLFALLKELNERLTIILVSHDPTFVSDFVERVVCVNRTVAMHPTADMNRESTRDLFGKTVRMVRHDLHGNGKQ